MLARDTSPDAHAAQICALRDLSPERRAEIAAELSDAVRCIALEGIRARHPDYTSDDARRALVRLLYGDEVARRVWPGVGAPPP